LFHKQLDELGLIVNEGKIVDASFVEAPRQRNSREENKKIKEGQGGELWEDKPHKKCQKDIDASWTKKNGQNYYGYKNHAKIDAGSKLIDTYAVSKASTHDSQELDEVLEEQDKGQDVFADSAYVGQEATLEKYKVVDQICEKGYKNKPLTAVQKASNKVKSKTRVRVQHIFGFMENSMGSMYNKKIGLKRAETVIGLMNLTYNMFRKIQLMPLMGQVCPANK